MPIYEYRCRHCGEEFEELVRMSTTDEEVPCPRCGEHQSDKRISAVASKTGGGSSSSAGASCGGGSGFT